MVAKHLKQQRAAKAQKSRSTVIHLPAPVGGWNARDSIASMAGDDAIEMINVFPSTTDVSLRYGSNGLSGLDTPETLIAYQGGTTGRLIVIGSRLASDITPGSAPGLIASGVFQNSRFQYINFAVSSGNYVVMVNGADLPFIYNGSVFSNPAITGATTTSFIHVNAHKNRLWFCEIGTLKAYYLPTGSIAGALSTLDLSSFCTRGGFLMAMATWTVDAGYGVDDLAVFITSEGEVLVYRGTDPASAATWALVGVWWIGSPIGRRCFVKYAGDLLIITLDGLYPMSGALQSSRTNPRVALTDKIQDAISTATDLYGNNFGWQIIPFPKQSMILVNVPIVQEYGAQQSEQYVMNTITKAWCRFQGWNAACFELFNDDLYFGGQVLGNSQVYQAWVGATDRTGRLTGKVLQAYNYFGSSAQQKRFTGMRPTLLLQGNTDSGGSVIGTVTGGMNVNFDTSLPNLAPAEFIVNGTGLWDSGIWDSALWSNELLPASKWMNPYAVGYSGAVRMTFSEFGMHARWVSTDIAVEAGAIL